MERRRAPSCPVLLRGLRLLAMLLLLLPLPACVTQRAATRPSTARPIGYIAASVRSDVQNAISPDSVTLLVLGFDAGAVLANSPADEEIQTWYQEHLRSNASNDFAEFSKQFGEGKYVFPALGTALLLGKLNPDTRAGVALEEWGDRGLRAMGIGGPAMIVAQLATGGSRPGESPDGSLWHPFQDNNGVSGHAFMGAVPFITAAKMTEDPYCKAGLYFCSTLTAWSRVNDNDHYASQAMLGWLLAYTACAAVDRTEDHFDIAPVPVGDGPGLGLVLEY